MHKKFAHTSLINNIEILLKKEKKKVDIKLFKIHLRDMNPPMETQPEFQSHLKSFDFSNLKSDDQK